MRKVLVVALSLFGCTEQDTGAPETRQADPSSVVAEVESAVWAFHAADTMMDASAVAGMLWPEFYMFADGNRSEYPDVIAGTYDFMSSLELFATEWTDLRIIPLDADHAVASFVFRDSIRTKSGALIRSSGPTTLVWERRAGEWGILYADADHYPTSQPE